jgi:hypothetical protein
VEGLPHLCSEVNEPFPNDTAAEFIPILAAYARFQDWDGVFFYDYHPWPGSYWREQPWSETRQHYWFDMANNPVKMAQLALGALMFLRGDAQTARQTIERRLPRAWALESVRQRDPESLRPYWLPDLPGRLALVHRTRIGDQDTDQLRVGRIDNPTNERILSDTGELIWEATPGDGRVLIDTPRQQAIIGRAGRRATSNLVLDLLTPFAAVQLASLEERPIAESERLVLVVGTRVANTGQTWLNDARQEPADWGHEPVRLEPAAASLALRGLAGARRVTVRPLDGCGQPGRNPYLSLVSYRDRAKRVITGA